MNLGPVPWPVTLGVAIAWVLAVLFALSSCWRLGCSEVLS